MGEKLQSLPIGIQSFERLHGMGKLYVDKTRCLTRLVEESTRVFLSRPRRFGKSLTLSTLDAMFRGKVELFKGLAAEGWVAEQAEHPAPVLRLDMSAMDSSDASQLKQSLEDALNRLAANFEVELTGRTLGGRLQDLIAGLFRSIGPVVVLVDEYDKPILDKIGDLEAAEAMRMVLRSFYTVVKACDEYLRFVMLTGISKFTKVGVFSAMNNLSDISMNRQYGNVVGYTQEELERDFSGWIDQTAEAMGTTRAALLERMKDYYDGFCFDGVTRLYNPFSILRFFSEARFANYWYASASPTFIVEYMKRHAVQDPAEYEHLEVAPDFAESQEIERARPESFLYQAGYLTIERLEERALILDYPNQEVRDALGRMYLQYVYDIPEYTPLGSKLWRALRAGDLAEAVRLYNTALAGLPYEDFKDPSESFYRSLFLMLLRGAGMTAQGEVHTHRGRSDVLVLFPDRVVVLEFKLARSAGEVARLRGEGEKQIEEKGYAKPYDAEGRAVTARVIVVDAEKHEAVL